MVMELRYMKKRLGLGIAAVLATMSFGQQAYSQAAPPWTLKGSDTWFDVITAALTACNAACPGTDNTNTISNLIYGGTGSGNGQTNLENNIQSIAPMSRNYTKAEPWGAAGLQNVGGLDAAVIDTKSGASAVRNINLPVTVNSDNVPVAVANNPSVACNFGTEGSCYTQLLEVVLAGPDGSGSVAACSSPARLQAISDLASYENIPSGTIAHFYRRDDNSGTTNTMMEKLQISRFCNGRARGTLGANTTDPTNNNLNNQDLDPIRRPCPGPLAGLKNTKCTNFSTGQICNSASDSNCTQGLVVAISDPDIGETDVTVSLGKRVGANSGATLMAYTGREGKNQVGAGAPQLNTISYSNTNVRLDAYLLSRRLFLMYASTNTDTALGGANQVSTEKKFYDWATDPSGNTCVGDGNPGRCHLDPIMVTYGFIPCLDDCTATPTHANLCNKTPYPLAPSTPANCVPSTIDGSVWNHGAVACTAGTICCSTGLACPGTLQCPAVGSLPANSACAINADCASGLTCQDIGIGINVCA